MIEYCVCPESWHLTERLCLSYYHQPRVFVSVVIRQLLFLPELKRLNFVMLLRTLYVWRERERESVCVCVCERERERERERACVCVCETF